ncbi:MAG: hypothetical protein GW946_02995 [Candidatus Pacebacteria bacterium]|nr:hypothetical protein [Candidatus Paceibacterota bacterium]PIR60333.1 MAG: hypothetical protein COU67_02570 [Candidatus Pacebacteria bacterium CG10_big_fil_rev_8_21_14_0_10_44_54]
MGALPKNKITRVERGKRRAGNKPNITKDIKTASIPPYKRGLVASILRSVGLSSEKPATTEPKKIAAAKTSAMQTTAAAVNKAAKPVGAVKTKARRQTQHKG